MSVRNSGSGQVRPSQQLSNPGLAQAGRHPSHSTASVQEGQIYRQSTPGKLLEGPSEKATCFYRGLTGVAVGCHSGPGGIHSRSHLFCYVPSWLVEVTFPLGAENDTCLGPPPRHERTRIKAED